MTNVLFFNPKHNIERPVKMSIGAAGIDLRADIDKEIILYPNTITMIPTGTYSMLENDSMIMVCSRSGLAAKGIAVANAPGIVDSDYRGEIKVLLINHSSDQFKIRPGDRIAQLIPVKILTNSLDIQDGMPDINTERGAGGFGSTGL